MARFGFPSACSASLSIAGAPLPLGPCRLEASRFTKQGQLQHVAVFRKRRPARRYMEEAPHIHGRGLRNKAANRRYGAQSFRQVVEASVIVTAAQYALRVTLALFTLKLGQSTIGAVKTGRDQHDPSFDTFEGRREKAEKLEGVNLVRALQGNFSSSTPLPRELSAWTHQNGDLVRRIRLEERVTKVDYAMASNILSQLSQLIDFSPKGCMVKRETPNCWSLCCGPLRAEVNSEKMRLCILVTKVPQQIELAIDIEETLQKKILRSL